MFVTTRTLQGKPPLLREKGIDVSLAIDVVAGAVADEFDVCIICSTDTDLIPAMEFIVARPHLQIDVEVAAWREHRNRPLGIRGKPVWAHLLSQADYELVHDPTRFVT